MGMDLLGCRHTVQTGGTTNTPHPSTPNVKLARKKRVDIRLAKQAGVAWQRVFEACQRETDPGGMIGSAL
jgi:hypothetical protein